MQMAFCVKLLTLGAITILINANFGIEIFGIGGIFGLVGNGEYYDFDRGWFYDVGAQVIKLVFWSTWNPILAALLQRPFFDACRWWFTSTTKTWTDLKKLHTLPAFPIAVQHAELLSAVFAVLILSSGLPVLNVLLLARMLLYFFTDRHMLLRGSSIPPRYTHHLALSMVRWLQSAVFIHTLLAIWIFGNPSLFANNRSANGNHDSNMDSVFLYASRVGLSYVVERATGAAAFPNTCLMIFVASIALGRVTLFILGRAAVMAWRATLLTFCFWRKSQVTKHRSKAVPSKSRKRNSAFEDFFDQRPMAEMRRNGVLHDYELLEQPDYKFLSATPLGAKTREQIRMQSEIQPTLGHQHNLFQQHTVIHESSLEGEEVQVQPHETNGPSHQSQPRPVSPKEQRSGTIASGAAVRRKSSICPQAKIVLQTGGSMEKE